LFTLNFRNTNRSRENIKNIINKNRIELENPKARTNQGSSAATAGLLKTFAASNLLFVGIGSPAGV
jgi:hypothetical protein